VKVSLFDGINDRKHLKVTVNWQ